MDTLFRLVSFQQPHPQQQQQQHQQQSDHSFNNSTSRTNSSSGSIRSSNKRNPNNNNNNNYYYQNYYNPTTQDQEECFNFFMDEEDFSSSSSHNNKTYSSHNNPTTTADNSNYFYYQHQHQHQYQSASQSVLLDPSSTTTSTPTDTPPPSHQQGGGSGGCQFDFSSPSAYIGKWASNALLEAGRAVSAGDTARLHQLIWMLNEVSSPYGDVEQKLASYFTQALFTRLTESGDTCYRNMRLAVDKTFSFESTRKMLLKFQEVSPWSTFGHVACNGALIDALEGEPKLHIIDISNTFCTQWPTLLEALATRMDDTPHLKITTVLVDKYGDGGEAVDGGVYRVMREIGSRLEKFARLMGVPFKFNVVHHNGDLSCLDFANLDLSDDEALAINCVNTLHGVSVHRRDAVLAAFRQLNPRVVAVMEEEADIGDVGPNDNDGGGGGFEFMRGFNECLRWFRVYFESLDETFPRTSHEKLMLERAAGRAMVDLLAGPERASAERRETAGRWSGRMGRAGLAHVGFSEEVCDDVRALLRRYKEGWSMTPCSGGDSGGGGAGIFLCWKDQPVVWASAWKPISHDNID